MNHTAADDTQGIEGSEHSGASELQVRGAKRIATQNFDTILFAAASPAVGDILQLQENTD